jgi:hypothetical protein
MWQCQGHGLQYLFHIFCVYDNPWQVLMFNAFRLVFKGSRNAVGLNVEENNGKRKDFGDD